MGCQAAGACCPDNFIGFCLSDGTPISIVVQGALQTGWINLLTGIFTPGPPPPGTVTCTPPLTIEPLDCATDSITICPPASGIFDVNVVNEVDTRLLDCSTDSITVCQPEVSADITSVNRSDVSVTLLAANTNRKGAIFYNNSTGTAWVKFGATASQTSFSVRLVSETFYELDFGYTGVIDGIWISAGAGAMRITEFI